VHEISIEKKITKLLFWYSKTIATSSMNIVKEKDTIAISKQLSPLLQLLERNHDWGVFGSPLSPTKTMLSTFTNT